MSKLPLLFVLGFLGCQSYSSLDQRYGVKGFVSPGFESIRDLFSENFDRLGEEGSALVIWLNGEKIVDLSGGSDGYGQAFTSQSKGLWFSATKGIAAMVLANLHAQGFLDYRAPVHQYWEDFRRPILRDITVEQLISHQAGLVIPKQKFSDELMLNLEQLEKILVETEPLWEPGDHHGYHAGTIGFFLNGLVRRIDPQGRTIGQFIAEEWCNPNGLDFSIGDSNRPPLSSQDVARTKLLNPFFALFQQDKMPPGFRKVVFDFNSLFFKSLSLGGESNPNKSAFWTPEQPSGNGIGSTQAMAQLYSWLATGDDRLGVGLDHPMVFEEATPPRGGKLDRVMNFETCYGMGWMKPDPLYSFSPESSAVGFMGLTSSLGFADPVNGIGYAFFTRKQGYHGVNDPREQRIRQELYRIISRLGEGN